MSQKNYLLGALFLLLTLNSSADSDSLFPASGISAQTEEIPSAFWPTFVETTQRIVRDEKEIDADTRGVLLRVEGNELIVDFGRRGVVDLDPKKTNFFEEVTKLMSGEEEKQFPNFSQQLGNKMMTFGRGKDSGPIRFREALRIRIYILLYLDQYSPSLAPALMEFGQAYEHLKERWPMLEVVLMPRDRTFYDFGATVGYSVPYIAPHMRLGYIDSLNHGADSQPAFVAVDDNGRVLYRNTTALDWEDLPDSLESLVNELGLAWSLPETRKKKAYQRTTHWNN